MTKFSDKQVWDALGVFESEWAKWRAVKIRPDSDAVWCVSDCLPFPPDITKPVPQTRSFECIDLKDEATAQKYIRWRAIKAVLESVVR